MTMHWMLVISVTWSACLSVDSDLPTQLLQRADVRNLVSMQLYFSRLFTSATLLLGLGLGARSLGGFHTYRMTPRKALAEIAVDPQRGWVLPGFGGQLFRYQAWAHFEKDTTRGSATWTSLVELAGAPLPSADKVEATVSFVAPGAQAVLEEGASFDAILGTDSLHAWSHHETFARGQRRLTIQGRSAGKPATMAIVKQARENWETFTVFASL